MSEVSFYETRLGRQYYEVTLPELVRQLTRLNDLLALGVELAEKHGVETPICRCAPDTGKPTP